MLERAIWLILGVVLGAVGSIVLYVPPQDNDRQVSNLVEATPNSGYPATEIGRTPSYVEEVLDTSNGDSKTDGEAEGTSAAPISNIPAVYKEVIGRPRPRQLRVADRHAIFLTEPRDEAWASAMESGISNYLADNASNMRIVVEFVECRSEHCEVAGYVHDGSRDYISGLRNGLKNSGWWQGGISSASTNKKIDGVDRFVIMFNRNVAWTRD